MVYLHHFISYQKVILTKDILHLSFSVVVSHRSISDGAQPPTNINAVIYRLLSEFNANVIVYKNKNVSTVVLRL